jgi:hypothetical protein
MLTSPPNSPITDPKLSVRIVDGSSSSIPDTLYFVGTKNNYIKKSAKSETINYSTFGNFWLKQVSAQSNFSDILDGGDSVNGSLQFEGPVVWGEFPIQNRLELEQ